MKFKSAVFSISIILLFGGCISARKKDVPSELPRPDSSAELQSLCAQGYPIACNHYGSALYREQKFLEAARVFESVCSRIDPDACTWAGAIRAIELKDQSTSMPWTVKACEGGDAMGCYNRACDSCIDHHPEEAREYLKRAILLGASGSEDWKKDSTLACLTTAKDFPDFMALEKKSSEHISMTLDHVYIPAYRVALLGMNGFNLVPLPDRIAMIDTSGAGVSVQNFPTSIQESLQALKQLPDYQELKDADRKDLIRNGMSTLIYSVNAKDGQHLRMVTGTELETWVIDGFVPDAMKMVMGALIETMVNYVVVNPFGRNNSDVVPYDLQKKIPELDYAGRYLMGFLYAAQGTPRSWKQQVEDAKQGRPSLYVLPSVKPKKGSEQSSPKVLFETILKGLFQDPSRAVHAVQVKTGEWEDRSEKGVRIRFFRKDFSVQGLSFFGLAAEPSGSRSSQVKTLFESIRPRPGAEAHDPQIEPVHTTGSGDIPEV